MKEEKTKCPKCGSDKLQTVTHQRDGYLYGTEVCIVDTGWKCCDCGNEFGFEWTEDNNHDTV